MQLKHHIQNEHENIDYGCVHCEYNATAKGSFKIHVQSKNEHIKFQCSQCDYKATVGPNLQSHKISKIRQYAD